MTDDDVVPMDGQPLWIEYQRIDEVRGDARNPKSHSIDEMRASLGRFGYTEPILVDERTSVLVAGHGRVELLLAEHAAGSDPPEGVTVDEDGGWLVPVTRGWASADDDEAAAYIVASNRLTELGGWLDDPLASLLVTIRDSPLGLAGIGFDDADVAALLAMLAEGEAGVPVEGDAERERVEFDAKKATTMACPHCGGVILVQ